MVKRIPVIARGVDLVRWFADVKAGKTDDLPEIECWLWPKAARRQAESGKLRVVEGIDAYQRVRALTRSVVLIPKMDIMTSRSETSSASISMREMNLYAGRHFRGGKSRTAGLSETARQFRVNHAAREGRRLPMEDPVERVVAKVESFAHCSAG